SINGPEDVDGLRIRVPVSPIWTSLFEALGAAPVSIPFGEVYMGLQTNVVEAQENPLSLISSARLFEVQRYCSLTRHMWDGFYFFASSGRWSQLPDDVKEIITRNLDAAAVAQRADIAAADVQLRASLEQAGMSFNEPDIEPFRAKLRETGYYADWREQFGEEAWALLEQYTGPLG
ncbi:MAG: TRAP transporter substrate-binding protein, partial [Paracoccus sp. (in: a-proteobacteria)]